MAQQTAVEWLVEKLYKEGHFYYVQQTEIIDKAKQMEKEQNDKWNEFLDAEKVLGISDVKTIERIQWYYNTYFNETYGK